MTEPEYLAAWGRLHGVDPGAVPAVRRWLWVVYRLSRPLAAARVPPSALTVLGVLVALAVLPMAALGGRWLLLAPFAVLASGVLDSLDGAVAVLSGRTSRWGAVQDSVADRVSDCGYVVALWLAGAPGWLAVLGGAVAMLLEYVRARAAGGGLTDIGVVTVGERPTRVVSAAMFLAAAGMFPAAAASWATAGAALGALAAVVGLGQLLVVVRRRLGPADLGGHDGGGHPDQG
jgi:phosphatidylglycerophosphate synthase